MLVEDHELPDHQRQRDDPRRLALGARGKVGLAAITGTVMRTGGSVTRNGDQLDRELDRLAASVEIGLGGDSGSRQHLLPQGGYR